MELLFESDLLEILQGKYSVKVKEVRVDNEYSPSQGIILANAKVYSLHNGLSIVGDRKIFEFIWDDLEASEFERKRGISINDVEDSKIITKIVEKGWFNKTRETQRIVKHGWVSLKKTKPTTVELLNCALTIIRAGKQE